MITVTFHIALGGVLYRQAKINKKVHLFSSYLLSDFCEWFSCVESRNNLYTKCTFLLLISQKGKKTANMHLLLQRYKVDKPANATSTHCAEGRADSSLWVIYMKRFTITPLYAWI